MKIGVKPNLKARKNGDIFSKKKRSEIMGLVKSKNTKLELSVFDALKKKGLRFKTHYNKVIGKPDIVVLSRKKAVFIDSDFWHGWRYPTWSNKLTSEFWVKKISNNRKRDKKVNRILKKKGWKILRVWEHQLTNEPDSTVKKIYYFLNEVKII